MSISSKHGNSTDEQIIVAYALRESYEFLILHMLRGVAMNNCTQKADAHIAICVKYALENGCKEKLVYNCYDSEDDDDGSYSDFDTFRNHTREVTDFLDEKLNWDMKPASINQALINQAVDLFKTRCSTYSFKKDEKESNVKMFI